MENYRQLLSWVDRWYRSVRRRHADQVTCTVGCRTCCIGLFDITLADRDLLRAGLARANPAVRKDIQRRADRLMRRVRSRYPKVRNTLAGLGEARIDELCDWLRRVECPALGSENQCRLYEFRPLTCRLHGVPVIGYDGFPLHEEGCGKCLLKKSDCPHFDVERLVRSEVRLLKQGYGSRWSTPLLIPQALATDV
jgi:Fe-S-cluster containining protein